MTEQTGKFLMIAGIILLLAGAVFYFGGKGSIGKLPGDIVVKKPGLTFYFPLGTSIIISLLLSIALYWYYKLRG
jgi:hypothetical protein